MLLSVAEFSPAHHWDVAGFEGGSEDVLVVLDREIYLPDAEYRMTV